MKQVNETDPRYLFPFICLACRKSFKRPANPKSWERPCPGCKAPAIQVGRKFRAPKSTNDEQWEKVRLLIENGFRFQSIYQGGRVAHLVPYPKSLAEAREWVTKWRHKTKDVAKADIKST